MEKKIWDFLKSEGFNDFGVAGLMGNLYAESGLQPNNMENQYQSKLGFTDESYTKAVDNGTYNNFIKDAVGYGLAQWTFWTYKRDLLEFAKTKGTSISDLDMQLEFLVTILRKNHTKTVYNVLKEATSILEASNAVLLKFERPANTSLSVQAAREKYGQKYYDKYAKKVTSKTEENEMSEYKKGQKVQVTQNFSSTEFDCHGQGCCSITKIDPKLAEYLQQIRKHFGKPVIVTSAYRCEKHNKNIGGATKSYHMRGQAADIVVSGVTSQEVAKYAESIGILGIGLYETSKDGYFVHIDTRTTKFFWYGQSQQPRSTFGGVKTPITESKPEGTNTQGAYHKSSNKYSIKLSFLQYNDRGRDIQILQELLKAHGYNIEVSGIFDLATKNAIIDFQKKTKIPADGVVGAQTMEKLLTA